MIFVRLKRSIFANFKSKPGRFLSLIQDDIRTIQFSPKVVSLEIFAFLIHLYDEINKAAISKLAFLTELRLLAPFFLLHIKTSTKK